MSFTVHNKFEDAYKMEYKKLVITGANGYLGQHTIKKAILNGWDVIGIVRREDAAKQVEILGAKAVVIKEFNYSSIKKVLQECKTNISEEVS